MRRGLVLAAVALLGACKGAPAPRSTSPAPRPGNGWSVLLITVDTLRADHLGSYGYRRATSPRIDSFGRTAMVFDQAYTYWPKTRASFVMLLTGRRPSQNGYSRTRPTLLGFNPTLASVLQDAGYRTSAIVDNANVARSLGYAKGFGAYRELWEEPGLGSEWDRTLAITAGGVRLLRQASEPFLLWLHYVNPHAPYRPPAPFDSRFVDAATESGPRLPVVPQFQGGIPKALHVEGHDRPGYYVAQYDGEVAAVDAQIGEVLAALTASPAAERTLTIVTSDHGESLGEHDYYFDHGADLYQPCLRIPLMIRVPGPASPGRSGVLASTLDLMPTVLDALKLPYPPDLAGTSLLPVLTGGGPPRRERLFAQNDRDLAATFDARFKLVASFGDQGTRYALYDRKADPGETRDVSSEHADELRIHRRELERYLELAGREQRATERLLAGSPAGAERISPQACEQLKALNYVQECPQ